MSVLKPQLTQEDGVWVIRVERENGKKQEYRCATERQAKQLATILAAGDKSVKAS